MSTQQESAERIAANKRCKQEERESNRRVRKAKDAIHDATLHAAGYLADEYSVKNPGVWASDVSTHHFHYQADMMEAVAEAAQEIAAKRAGFDTWAAFEAARMAAEQEDEQPLTDREP